MILGNDWSVTMVIVVSTGQGYYGSMQGLGCYYGLYWPRVVLWF